MRVTRVLIDADQCTSISFCDRQSFKSLEEHNTTPTRPLSAASREPLTMAPSAWRLQLATGALAVLLSLQVRKERPPRWWRAAKRLNV